MAHSGKKVSAPVIFADVNAVVGTAHTDLGLLCKDSNINMWAKCKPEGVASGQQTMPIGILTSAMRRLNSYGIRTLYQNGYGAFDGNSGLVKALRDGTVKATFEYIKPSGGSSSPYRLADFDGYYQDAKAPLWSPYNSSDVLDVSGTNTLQLYYYANVNGSDSEIGLSDLRFSSDSKTFANYYFGILIWNNNSYYAATQDHVMGSSWQEGLDVTLQGVPQGTYTYNMIPFFATQQISTQSASFTGTIFPMTFAQAEIHTGAASRWVNISTWVYVWSDDMSKLRLKWSVSNHLSDAFLFDINSQNSYVTIGNPEQQGTYGSWGISVSQSIPAGTNQSGDVLIASNLLSAQQDFIRNGDSNVHIQANRYNAQYVYNDIVQIWDRSNP